MGDTKGRPGDETLELTVHGYGAKLPLGFITRMLFPGYAATADTFALLAKSAAEKHVRGVPLSSQEQAAFQIAMAPIWKKAARVQARIARAEEILSADVRRLPGSAGPPAPKSDKDPAPPSEAWRDRWVAGAELASDDHVEEIWSQILAGELRTPGTFSFKTLSVLKDVDTATAETFVRLLGLLMQGSMVPDWQAFKASYEKDGFRYVSLLELADAGLLHFERSIMNTDAQAPQVVACTGGVFVMLEQSAVHVPVHILTRAGAQLATIASPLPRAAALNALGAWFRSQYLSVKVGLRSPEYKITKPRRWLTETLSVDDAGVVQLAESEPDPEPVAG